MRSFLMSNRFATKTWIQHLQTKMSSSNNNNNNNNKHVKLTKYIGTHDGTFHCDDVTACCMLKQLARFKDHDIVRTRDQALLDGAEIVVDVGGVLDVEKLRLDHHQRSFNQTIHDYHPKLPTTNPKKSVKLSSAGLTYALFGHELIATVLELGEPKNLQPDHKKMVDALYDRIYVEFLEEIDGIDNGFEVVEGDDVVYNYHINTGISHRVGRQNPIDKNASPETRLECFHKAMEIVKAEIVDGIKYLGTVWWPMREKFKKDVQDRFNFHPSGEIVHILGEMVGWKSNIIELEKELGIEGEIKFVVFPEGDRYRVMTMPVTFKSFLSRVPLKEEWRGKRDEELAAISGVEGAVFVHASGFTGGAKTLDGVMSFIEQTLKDAKK